MTQDLGHLLLIEDNPDDYESLMRSFRKVNLLNPVHWCPDGCDALDYLHRREKYQGDPSIQPPSLIMLDLNLPGMDGRKVLQSIKSDPLLRSVPVVVLTTSNDRIDIDKCYQLGANTYIQKPVGFDGLIEASARIKGYWFGVALLPMPPVEMKG